MNTLRNNLAREIRIAKSLYGNLHKSATGILTQLIRKTRLSIIHGDIVLIGDSWYVKHSGLLALANRRHCHGICSKLILAASQPDNSKWVFKATVFSSPSCQGFVGYGDANPSNVSPLVHGAEMRVAETRAVNPALRKAYGIGICSLEELGALTFEKQMRENGGKLPLLSLQNRVDP